MCEVSELGFIHVCEDFAEFGYMLERKVEKFRNRAIFWQHTRAYSLNLSISKTSPHNVATFGPFSSPPPNDFIRYPQVRFGIHQLKLNMPKILKSLKQMLIFLRLKKLLWLNI